MNPPALDGLRVLDLTRLLPGPLATWMMAELGADVIKVEDPRLGDLTRHLPPMDQAGHGALFSFLNRSKRSLALDLKRKEGHDIFMRLVETCDLVVEGFRPGVMERLGLDYESLKQRKSDVILCSISGYGQTGPLTDRAGHDLNFQALAGLLSQQGPAGQPPALSAVPVADVIGGTWQALAALFGALYQRERTGQGQWLDVAMCDGALSALVMPLADLALGKPIPPRGRGPLTGALPAYGVFATADGGYLSVAAIEPKFFDNLMEVLDLEQHKGQAGLSGEAAQSLRADIAERLASKDLQHWVERLDGVETCCEPVVEVFDLPKQAQFAARGLFRPGPEGPRLASPLRLAGGLRPESEAPSLGQHSAEVLKEMGLDESSIQDLAFLGILRRG